MPYFAARGIIPIPSGVTPLSSFLARANAITTLSGTETTAYTNLFNGLTADGTLSLLDILYIFATASSGVALLNLVANQYNGTNSGSTLIFTVDQGFNSIGSSLLNTGFNPTTAVSPNWQLNSASMGQYTLTSDTGNRAIDCALYDGSNSSGIRSFITAGLFGWSINDNQYPAGFPTATTANANAQGQFVCSRTSSTTILARKNGGAGFAASASVNSIAVPNQVWCIFGDQPGNGGFYAGSTADICSAWFCGGGLTTTQMDNVASRINAYMTTLGINVY